jgi:hypothetical protein
MGGLGSGRRNGQEPRRTVERAFALDIEQVLGTGSRGGRAGGDRSLAQGKTLDDFR